MPRASVHTEGEPHPEVASRREVAAHPGLGSIQVAGGSVPGLHHVRSGRNNQDAHAWVRSPGGVVAVVADGCGSGEASELGARLGARLAAGDLASRLGRGEPEEVLEATRGALLARLRLLAEDLSLAGAGAPRHPAGELGGFGATLRDHLLFTLVGAVVEPTRVWTFALGDGVLVVNGELVELGPFPGNSPPYLAYGLMGEGGPRFEVLHRLPREELVSILIGTDGVRDLVELADEPVAGGREPVGELSQFWREDRFFRNPDMVRRRLVVAGRGEGGGRLPDDTTLVVLRDSRVGEGEAWKSS